MAKISALDRVADRLYGLDPAEFIAARGTEVAAARGAGEKDLAAAIGKLRRPTRAAWLVNQLARRYPDRVAALFDLGEQLGAAQRELRGRDLRTLSTRRQQHLDDLVARIREIDPDAREPLPAEVRATLTAAVSDPDLAAQVRAGHLTATTTYSGFGPLTAVPPALPDRATKRPPSPERRPPPDRTPARSPSPERRPPLVRADRSRTVEPPAGRCRTAEPPAGKPKSRPRVEPEPDKVAAARAEARLARAREALDQARAAERQAAATVDDLAAELSRLHQRERDLRRRHAAAERQLARATARREAAEEHLARGGRHLSAVPREGS